MPNCPLRFFAVVSFLADRVVIITYRLPLTSLLCGGPNSHKNHTLRVGEKTNIAQQQLVSVVWLLYARLCGTVSEC